MWQASVGWMRRAVDTAMVSGSATAVIAYSILHSHEMLSFIRCSLIGCGQPPDQ
jgi:hypothetical protein